MADRGIADVARLLSQAANSLRGLTPAPSTSSGSQATNSSDRAQAELKRAFSPYPRDEKVPVTVSSTATCIPRARGASSQSRAFTFTRSTRGKNKKTKEITAKWFCLANTKQDEVPCTEDKRELLTAGLGEKKVSLPENSSSAQLHNMVVQTFPKLIEAGGYEFMHAEPSSRQLKAITPGPDGYTMDYLKQFVGQGRIYIRPIQSNLNVDDVVTPDKKSIPEEFCQSCFNYYPMNELREHLDVCVPFDLDGTDGEKKIPQLKDGANTKQLPPGLASEENIPPKIVDEKNIDTKEKIDLTHDDLGNDVSQAKVDVIDHDVDDGSYMNSIWRDSAMEGPIKTIRVHRSLIRQDMIEIFSDESILKCTLCVVIINQYGNDELGSGTGALREIFTLFWKDCYESHMLGENERVPYIRHDFNRTKWESVGRILVKGYIDCHYFPLKMSRSFLAACRFGEGSVTNIMLIDSFKNYVSKSEANIIDKCLRQDIVLDDDELLEFLSTFDCKRLVTNSNLTEIITELAHKEIIQKPKYVADCWRRIVSYLKACYFTNTSALLTCYDSILPTNSKVISLFKATPVGPAESETLGHLKRFVRGLDEAILATFFRYTTASDVLVTDSIEITFTTQEGLQRRPVAHTWLLFGSA